jgi:hypothetical protein
MIMKIQYALIGLLLCGFLSGCKNTETLTMCPGPFTSHSGVTYYPAHPGTTNYSGTVDYTTNPPPAGVRPYVVVVTTNAHWGVNVIDGNEPASASTLK